MPSEGRSHGSSAGHQTLPDLMIHFLQRRGGRRGKRTLPEKQVILLRSSSTRMARADPLLFLSRRQTPFLKWHILQNFVPNFTIRKKMERFTPIELSGFKVLNLGQTL